MTGARVIGGLTPCNVIPDEILTDHPKRFRAMLVESGNPAHSLADSARMREAIAALELVVVIDVAFTETARLAHYVLPVASQYEKAEATFFNFEFPHNYFHLRKALVPPLPGLFSEAELHARLLEALGALPADAVAALRAAWLEGRQAFREKFFALAGANPRACSRSRRSVLYRAIGDLLPKGLAEAAGVWALCQIAAQRHPQSLARAGFAGEPGEAADALFDALLTSKSAVVFAVDAWEENLARVRTPNGRVQLAIAGAVRRARRPRHRVPDRGERRVPVPALRRRAPLVHGQHDHAQPRLAEEGRRGRAAHESRRTPSASGVANGGRVRISTRRGSAEVAVEVSDRMQPGHVSLPNGLGLDFPDASGATVATGVAPNELTRGEDRDWIAGTPWHKSTPARVEAL